MSHGPKVGSLSSFPQGSGTMINGKLGDVISIWVWSGHGIDHDWSGSYSEAGGPGVSFRCDIVLEVSGGGVLVVWEAGGCGELEGPSEGGCVECVVHEVVFLSH